MTRSRGCYGSLLGIECPKQMNDNSDCCSFALDGFIRTIQHGRLAKSRAADCCSMQQSAARENSGFQSVSDGLCILGHSWVESIQTYVQSNRLNMIARCPKIPNSEIAPQAGKIGASASGPPVGCRASDGIKPSGQCSRSHSTLRGANVPRGETCASEEHWRKS